MSAVPAKAVAGARQPRGWLPRGSHGRRGGGARAHRPDGTPGGLLRPVRMCMCIYIYIYV